MEGYLKKWTNVIKGWKPRYFILENCLLRYHKYRFTAVKDKIDLSKSEISLHPKDNLRITITIK